MHVLRTCVRGCDVLGIDLGGVEPMQLKADMEMSANMWVKELSIACMV